MILIPWKIWRDALLAILSARLLEAAAGLAAAFLNIARSSASREELEMRRLTSNPQTIGSHPPKTTCLGHHWAHRFGFSLGLTPMFDSWMHPTDIPKTISGRPDTVLVVCGNENGCHHL